MQSGSENRRWLVLSWQVLGTASCLVLPQQAVAEFATELAQNISEQTWGDIPGARVRLVRMKMPTDELSAAAARVAPGHGWRPYRDAALGSTTNEDIEVLFDRTVPSQGTETEHT